MELFKGRKGIYEWNNHQGVVLDRQFSRTDAGLNSDNLVSPAPQIAKKISRAATKIQDMPRRFVLGDHPVFSADGPLSHEAVYPFQYTTFRMAVRDIIVREVEVANSI